MTRNWPAGRGGATSPAPPVSPPICSTVSKRRSAAARLASLGRVESFADRRHRRSGVRSTGRRGRDPQARRNSPPILRRPRYRDRGRPRLRRCHGTRHHSHQNRGACRRCLGVLLLPPAWHPLSAGLYPLFDPFRLARRHGPARCAHIRLPFLSPVAATAAIRWQSAAAGASI